MTRGIALLLLLVTLGCAGATPGPVARTPQERVVRAFVDAFNAHDVEAMLALATDDVEWLAVAGRDVSVEAEGADALREGMTGYFAACESCRSELASVMVAGRRVTTLEVAHWTGADGPQSQRSLAVYELDGERIRRVYYFPTER